MRFTYDCGLCRLDVVMQHAGGEQLEGAPDLVHAVPFLLVMPL